MIQQLMTYGGWLLTALTVTLLLLRRVQGWDKGEQSYKATHGDADSKDAKERDGLLTRQADTEKALGLYQLLVHGDPTANIEQDPVRHMGLLKAVQYAFSASSLSSKRVRWLQEALGAPGSREDIVIDGLRKSLDAWVIAAAREEIERERRDMINKQNLAFGERNEEQRGNVPLMVPRPRPMLGPHRTPVPRERESRPGQYSRRESDDEVAYPPDEPFRPEDTSSRKARK